MPVHLCLHLQESSMNRISQFGQFICILQNNFDIPPTFNLGKAHSLLLSGEKYCYVLPHGTVRSFSVSLADSSERPNLPSTSSPSGLRKFIWVSNPYQLFCSGDAVVSHRILRVYDADTVASTASKIGYHQIILASSHLLSTNPRRP